MGWHSFIHDIGDSITNSLKGDFLSSGDSLLDSVGADFEGFAKKGWREISGEAAQERLMELQNEYNIKNWEMQNAYNTPAAQMLRYAEAGLNPNLIYGQSNMAGSIGGVTHGNVKSGMDMIGTVLSYVLGMQDLKNKKASEKLASSQADYVSAQTRRYNWDTDWLENHNTSSFEPGTVRTGKSLFDMSSPYLQEAAEALGTVRGAVENYFGDQRSVVLHRSAFRDVPLQQVIDIIDDYRRRGFHVDIEYD